jgi:hypothetical protein
LSPQPLSVSHPAYSIGTIWTSSGDLQLIVFGYCGVGAAFDEFDTLLAGLFGVVAFAAVGDDLPLAAFRRQRYSFLESR